MLTYIKIYYKFRIHLIEFITNIILSSFLNQLNFKANTFYDIARNKLNNNNRNNLLYQFKIKTNKINILFNLNQDNKRPNVKYYLNLSYHLIKTNIIPYTDLNHLFKIIKDHTIKIIIIISHNRYNRY